MAIIQTGQDSFSPTIRRSTLASMTQGFQQKLIPKNLDGTVYNCTGYNVATLYYPIVTPLATTTGTQALTIVTADATGIVVNTSESQSTTLAGNLTQNSTPCTIVIGDGTNTAIASAGTLSLVTQP